MLRRRIPTVLRFAADRLSLLDTPSISSSRSYNVMVQSESIHNSRLSSILRLRNHQALSLSYVPTKKSTDFGKVSEDNSFILDNLRVELPITSREEYLIGLATSQKLTSSSSKAALPAEIYPLLESIVRQNTSTTALVKVIQSIGDLRLPSPKSLKERYALAESILDRLSETPKTNLSLPPTSSFSPSMPLKHSSLARPGNTALWQHSDSIGRCLLSLRKMQVTTHTLSTMHQNILLDLIDTGFRLHQEQRAQQVSSFFNFANLIHNTARVGVSWSGLLPSTQSTIKHCLLIHGKQLVSNTQQQAMLINGLGEMSFPLTTDMEKEVQQVVLNWARHALQSVVEEMTPSELDNTNTNVTNPISRHNNIKNEKEIKSKHQQRHNNSTSNKYNQNNRNMVTTQAVSSVIYGLSEMGVRFQPFLTIEQRAILLQSVALTIADMPPYLACTTVYNLGLMGVTWNHWSKDAQTQLLSATLQALAVINPQTLSLLLSGLVNMHVDMRLLPSSHTQALDASISRCLLDIRHIHFAKSSTIGRLLRSLGDLHMRWSQFSLRTQSALLEKFRTSFDYFSAREVVMGIRGMGLLEIPPAIIRSPELFSCILLAIDRVHSDLHDRDVAALILGLSNLHVSWSSLPVNTRKNFIRILQQGHGIVTSSNNPNAATASNHSIYADYSDDDNHHKNRHNNNEATSGRTVVGGQYNLMAAAPSTTVSSSLLSYLLVGLGGMQISWKDLEAPLRENILSRLAQPHALNVLYPQDIARVFWGLGKMDVLWPEDLFHKMKRFSPHHATANNSSSSINNGTNNQLAASIDRIPIQLLRLWTLTIPKMQLLDVLQSLQGCVMLGITWTELATTTGHIHHRLLHRIVTLLSQATTENAINIIHELSCLSFESDARYLLDKPTTSSAHSAQKNSSSTNNQHSHSVSLLDTFEIILTELHTKRDVRKVAPVFQSKYQVAMAYIATLPQGPTLIARSRAHSNHHHHNSSSANNNSRSSNSAAEYGHGDDDVHSDPDSTRMVVGDLYEDDSAVVSAAVRQTSLQRLTAQVAQILRQQLLASSSSLNNLIIEESFQSQTHNHSNNDHQFSTQDIVVRSGTSSNNIIAVIELEDQRIRYTPSSSSRSSSSSDGSSHEEVVSLGKPRKYFLTLPHLLKRKLYRHYLPDVPIFRVEINNLDEDSTATTARGSSNISGDNNASNWKIVTEEDRELQTLSNMKSVKDVVASLHQLVQLLEDKRQL